jgi:hypothetical protein
MAGAMRIEDAVAINAARLKVSSKKRKVSLLSKIEYLWCSRVLNANGRNSHGNAAEK